MSVLSNRHISVFDPSAFKDSITVCGCGATGSRIITELIKLGIENMTIFDFDIVSEENVANQAFNNSDIGLLKAEAMKNMALLNNVSINANNVALTEDYEPDGYLFMCADSMEVRRTLIKRWIMSQSTKAVFEMRMGADEMRVYVLRNYSDYSSWLKVSDYKDEEASESLCGSKTSVGATAGMAAMATVWQFLNVIKNVDTWSNETVIYTSPFDIVTRDF